MRHNNKFEEEQKLRRLYRQYIGTYRRWGEEYGEWVEVEPYQLGWERSYTLRSDIKNRKWDVKYIRDALKLINTTLYCRKGDFLRKNYKTKKWVPVEQGLRAISIKEWDKQIPNIQKLFIKTQYYDKRNKSAYYMYAFKYPYYFVFKTEPRIITHHWIPDSEWETYCAEIRNRVSVDNMWPKMWRAAGGRTRSRASKAYNERDAWFKHKYGEDIEINYADFEEEDIA
jgi:hypothetical protein